MEDLTKLPISGPTLAEKLTQFGVTYFDRLIDIGSIEAMNRIGQADRSACYNMLYAIEGSIRGVRWHLLSQNERAQLKLEFDQSRRG
jgi:DNA transformation protein